MDARNGRRQAFLSFVVVAAVVGAILALAPARGPARQAMRGSPTVLAEETPSEEYASSLSDGVVRLKGKILSDGLQKVLELDTLVDKKGVVHDFGRRADEVVRSSMAKVGKDAEARALVEQALDAQLLAIFRRQLVTLRSKSVDHYEAVLSTRPNPLEASEQAVEIFTSAAKGLVRPGSSWSYDVELRDLQSWLAASDARDSALLKEKGQHAQGKQVTIEVIRQLQQQAAAVQREAETRGAFPWEVKWQYFLDNSPLGFRGQYTQGRSVVELLLMPSPDPRLKKNWLNRIGPLNLAVAFDMLL